MQHLDTLTCWRNRQAEIEFHIRRHEWFLGRTADPEALQHKIESYRLEWSSYERLIRKVQATREASTKSAA
jgi:hypothetical protein